LEIEFPRERHAAINALMARTYQQRIVIYKRYLPRTSTNE